MADKIYQKQNGQLVEVNVGGSGGGYTLPPATGSSLGGVIVGGGLEVTSGGTLSVSSAYVTSSAAQSIASAIVTSGGYVTSSYVASATVASAGKATSATTVNGHTVSANVPANAEFTDTTYTLGTAAYISAGDSESHVWRGNTLSAALVTTQTDQVVSGAKTFKAGITVSGTLALPDLNTNIPAEDSANHSKFLRGDGKWRDVEYAGSAGTITSTLPVSRGGTGKTGFSNTNGVLTVAGTSAGDLTAVATANGALYATAANGVAKFGTLPVAQGGTGATTLASAGIVTKVGAANVAYASGTARNGYYEINNGGTRVQVAFGRCSASSAGGTISFAHAFGAAPFIVAAAAPGSDPSGSGNNLSVLTGPATTTGASVLVRKTDGAAITAWVNYIAIGTGA